MKEKQEGRKRGRLGLKAAALLAITMMIAVAALGSGAISYNAAGALTLKTEDLGTRFVPDFSYADYRIAHTEVVQRMDALGPWVKIGDPEFTDSTLVCGHNEGINLTVADDANIDDGTVYEMKARANATSAVGFFELENAAGTKYIKLGFAATGKITCVYTAPAVTTVNVTSSYVANTYYDMSIEFGDGQFVASVSHDNGTLISASTVTTYTLDYTEIELVVIEQTSATRTMTVDWYAQTSSNEEFVPVGLTSSGTSVAPTSSKDYMAMKVDFGTSTPGTFSNDPIVAAAMNRTAADTSVSNDRDVNLTDFADQLAVTKEDTVAMTGIAKFQGWEDLRADTEHQLCGYLADKHGVATADIALLDYYVTDASVDTSWSLNLEKQVKSAWYSAVKRNAGDIGAELKFGDGSVASSVSASLGGTKAASMAILHGYEDLQSIALSSETTQAQWDSFRKAVSNDMRKQGIACALIAQTDHETLANNGLIQMDAGGQYTLSVSGSSAKNLQDSYQYTDAMTAEVMQDKGSCSVDVNTVQADQNWTVLENGKPAATPATTMVMLSTDLYWMLVVVVIVAIAIAIVCAVVMTKRRRRK